MVIKKTSTPDEEQEEEIYRTECDQKRAIEIYDSFRDDLNKRSLSNSENYDRAILTLSSSGLAISLTFLKFLVPPDKASGIWMMQLGWICFLISIVITIIAFRVGNKAIEKQLEIAEEYYVNNNPKAFDQKNCWSMLNNCLNSFVGLLFSIALILIVIFVIKNINEKENPMTDKKIENSTSQESGVIKESAPVPNLQKAPGTVKQKEKPKPPQKPNDKNSSE